MANLRDLPYELREQILIDHFVSRFVNQPGAKLGDAAIFKTGRQMAREATDATPEAVATAIAITEKALRTAEKEFEHLDKRLTYRAPAKSAAESLEWDVKWDAYNNGTADEATVSVCEKVIRAREESAHARYSVFAEWQMARDKTWRLQDWLEELQKMQSNLERRHRGKAIGTQS